MEGIKKLSPLYQVDENPGIVILRADPTVALKRRKNF
jgi:hypothetical protein